jgi:hypothetical protein
MSRFVEGVWYVNKAKVSYMRDAWSGGRAVTFEGSGFRV